MSLRRKVAISAVIVGMVVWTVPVVLLLALQGFPPVQELIDEGVRFRNLTVVVWAAGIAVGLAVIVALLRLRRAD
jgi:hypothetical protein